MEISKIQKARAGLVYDEPFFATLALKLKLLEDPSSTNTWGWTDGVTLAYHPEKIEELTLDQVKWFVAHETMHNAMGHHTRRQHRDPKKWNYACDYVVNLLLQKAGFHVPPGALMDPAYEGMSTEEVYNKIPDPPPNENPDGGDVRDGPGKDGQKPTQADLAEQEQDWKQAVAQAAQVAKKAGKLPAGMDRFVDEIINPKLDWREILRRFIDQNAKNDFSWAPPNRRYLDMGMYLPSLRSKELGTVAIAVDTSGSISKEDLDCFASEISSILEGFNAVHALVLYCDTRVAGVETFTKEDLPITLKAVGGGGTDFTKVFDYVIEKDVAPKCLIYFTDMCGVFPRLEPEYPVLWVTDSTSEAPFGETISMA